MSEEQKEQSETTIEKEDNSEQQGEEDIKSEGTNNHEEENNQSNIEDINENESAKQTVDEVIGIANNLTNGQTPNENIENQNENLNDEEETNQNENNEITNENNFQEEGEPDNNENIQIADDIQLHDENNLANNEAIINNFDNIGTKLQIGDEEEEKFIPISYQSSGYTPNLRNSQSFAIEHPIEFNNEDQGGTGVNPHRGAQSQRVGPPTEPNSSRNKVAPRPNSQRRKGKNTEIRVETIVDEDRPMSSCSSYSYTYSYSEVEEEITRPVRRRKTKEDYVPDYIKAQLELTREQQTQRSMSLSEADLAQLKKRALELQPIENYDDDVYSAVLDSLIEDRNVEASQENFKICEQLNRAIEHVHHCQVEQRKYNLQNESYNGMMDQLDEIQMQLSLFDNETKQLEDELLDQTNNQIDRVKSKHQEELDKIQDNWNKESKMRQYNRASPRLVFLRKQFKQLMRQCKFAEAEETKSIIQKLEVQERQKAEISMSTRFQEAVTKVENRQEEELRFYQTKQDIRIKKLRVDRAKLREAIINKQRKVEEMKDVINDPDKLWNYSMSQKKKNNQSPGATSRSGFDMTMSNNNANLSRLTSRDFTDREETTLALPPLKLKRNTKATASKTKK